MKKAIWLFLAVCAVMALTCAAQAGMEHDPADSIHGYHLPDAWRGWNEYLRRVNEQRQSAEESVFLLPEALQFIEDEAFEGTAASKIILPEQLQAIGQRAFADNPMLTEVIIPDSVRSIASDAFVGSHKVMITASAGSYAGDWAGKHGLRLRPVVTAVTAGQTSVTAETETSAENHPIEKNTAASAVQEKSRQRRPDVCRNIIVLQPVKGRAALHVQSRYFP